MNFGHIKIEGSQEHEKAPSGTTDLEMIKNPKYWPHQVLPLVNRSGEGMPQTAVLHFVPTKFTFHGKYYLCAGKNIFQTSHALEDGSEITPEEVIDQGWMVD